jgi:cytochrome c oxidase subunit 4
MTRVTASTATATALALFALWGASWGLSYLELGAWSLPVALAIATAKAALVVLFFMEIVLEKTAIHVTLATGLVMIAALISFMVADVRTRTAPLLPPEPQARGDGPPSPQP